MDEGVEEKEEDEEGEAELPGVSAPPGPPQENGGNSSTWRA